MEGDTLETLEDMLETEVRRTLVHTKVAFHMGREEEHLLHTLLNPL